jgi:hypothetical protein
MERVPWNSSASKTKERPWESRDVARSGGILEILELQDKILSDPRYGWPWIFWAPRPNLEGSEVWRWGLDPEIRQLQVTTAIKGCINEYAQHVNRAQGPEWTLNPKPAPTSAPTWMDGALMGGPFSSLPVPGLTKVANSSWPFFLVLSSAQVGFFLGTFFSSPPTHACPCLTHLPTFRLLAYAP